MGFEHAMHLLYLCNEAIKMIGSPCLCLGRWLCKDLQHWSEPVYLFLRVPTFFLNIIPWDLRNADSWSGGVGFASSHYLSTNGIVFLHDGKTAWNLQLCLCYGTHNETWEWKYCPWVPLGDALGQKVVYMTAYVDLLMCEEIIQENGSWSRQCFQVHHWVEVVDHYIS